MPNTEKHTVDDFILEYNGGGTSPPSHVMWHTSEEMCKGKYFRLRKTLLLRENTRQFVLTNFCNNFNVIVIVLGSKHRFCKESRLLEYLRGKSNEDVKNTR